VGLLLYGITQGSQDFPEVHAGRNFFEGSLFRGEQGFVRVLPGDVHPVPTSSSTSPAEFRTGVADGLDVLHGSIGKNDAKFMLEIAFFPRALCRGVSEIPLDRRDECAEKPRRRRPDRCPVQIRRFESARRTNKHFPAEPRFQAQLRCGSNVGPQPDTPRCGGALHQTLMFFRSRMVEIPKARFSASSTYRSNVFSLNWPCFRRV